MSAPGASRALRKRLALVSVTTYALLTVPLAFVAIEPWSADALNNGVPVIRAITGGHVPYRELVPSFVPGVVSALLSALLGVAPETVLSFVPQAIFAVGVFAFGLLASDYLDDADAGVWAAVFFGTFGPTVYWAAQGVRESYGLAFLPWVLWTLWYYLDRRSGPAWLLFAFGTSVLMTTHHWTSFMYLVGTTPLLALATLRRNWHALVAQVTATTFFGVYWFGTTDFIRTLMLKALTIWSDVLLSSGGAGGGGTGGSSGGGGGVAETIQQLLVLPRPPQMFLTIILLGTVATVGVALALRRRNWRVVAMAPAAAALALLFPLAFLLGGSFVVYDPLRVLEFLAFPGSVAGGYAVSAVLTSRVDRSRIEPVLLVLAVGSGLVFYPPVYYSGVHFGADNPLYDVRGDKFYATTGDVAAVEFAAERGYQLRAPGISTVNVYARNRLDAGRCAVWITPSVRRVQAVSESIATPLRTDEDIVHESTTEGRLVYANERGRLYLLPTDDPCWPRGDQS